MEGTSEPSRPAMEFQSMIETSIPIFQCFKYMGVFPYLLEYEEGPYGKGRVLKRITYHRSGVFVWLNRVVWISLFLHWLFEIHQLYVSVHVLRLPFSSLVVLTCFICSAMHSLIVSCLFHLKKTELCEFLTSWHHVEQVIVKEAGQFEDEELLRAGFRRQIRLVHRHLVYLVSASLCLSTLFVTFNQVTNPRGLAYVYSLLPPSETSGPLRIFSIGLQGFAMFGIWLGYFLYETLGFGFAKSMSHTLRLLYFSPAKAPPLSIWTSALERQTSKTKPMTFLYTTGLWFGSSLDSYGRVQALVSRFNAIFSTFIFVGKSLNMVNLCCLLYVPLRYGRDTEASTSLTLFCLSVSVLYRLYLLMTTTAEVYESSVGFRESWVRAIRHLPADSFPMTRLNKERLYFLETIRFRSGIFYDMLPTTLLTFLSITTTYVIVLLQI